MEWNRSTRIWIWCLSAAVVLVSSFLIYSEMKQRFSAQYTGAVSLAGSAVMELHDAARE